MSIETILGYLNAVPVRATYGAVADVLGVRPQVVPRLLGPRRPEASWVVNGSTGEPTGYAPDEVDPRLPGSDVVRTGDELRRRLESVGDTGAVLDAAPDAAPVAAPDAALVAAPDAAPVAVPEAAPVAVPEAAPAVDGTGGMGSRETESFDLGGDARWIIGTLVPVFLLMAGLLAVQTASVGRGLHTRIDGVSDRIDDLAEQVGALDARIGDVGTELRDEIAVLRSDVGSIAERLSADEPASGGTEPDVAPAPDAGEPTVASDAPEASPDPEPEPPADPDAPTANPAPPRE